MKSNRIKIFFFIDSFMIGGMHRQVLNLVRHIDRDIFDPIMCTSSSKGGLRVEFEKTGCKLIDLNWKRKFDPPIILRFIKILKQERPDIIFITEAHNLFYYRLAKLFWFGKVVQIGSFRALTFWQGNKGKLYKEIDNYFSRLLYKTSTCVIANSVAVKDHYSSIIKVKSNNPIQVIYNGSDFKFPISKSPIEIREELNICFREIVIIMVARLDPWKDFITLFEAAKVVIRAEPRAKFFIVGDGELRNELEALIINMELKDKVILLGEKKDVINYINAADISVLSTHGEGFSNSIMESMALSKPVIATNVGGNAEVIGTSNESGILVLPKAPNLFADAILFLIKNESERKNMGEAAKNRIYQLCSIKRYISCYEKLFRKSVTK